MCLYLYILDICSGNLLTKWKNFILCVSSLYQCFYWCDRTYLGKGNEIQQTSFIITHWEKRRGFKNASLEILNFWHLSFLTCLGGQRSQSQSTSKRFYFVLFLLLFIIVFKYPTVNYPTLFRYIEVYQIWTFVPAKKISKERFFSWHRYYCKLPRQILLF